jgi:hypothetical protein
MVISIGAPVFRFELILREGNRYTEFMQDHFTEKFPEVPVPHRNAVRTLAEKFRKT